MRKSLIFSAGMLIVLLSCRIQKKVEFARLQEGQNSGVVFTFDTNMLLNLALEDFLVENCNSNLLISPGAIGLAPYYSDNLVLGFQS